MNLSALRRSLTQLLIVLSLGYVVLVGGGGPGRAIFRDGGCVGCRSSPICPHARADLRERPRTPLRRRGGLCSLSVALARLVHPTPIPPRRRARPSQSPRRPGHARSAARSAGVARQPAHVGAQRFVVLGP